MPGFTVYGADGRRVVRGYAESAARELAARIHADSGETLTVVEDGVAVEAAPAPVVAEEGKRPLEDLSGKELKQLAAELGVTFPRRAFREQKIAALREALAAAEPADADESTMEPDEGAED